MLFMKKLMFITSGYSGSFALMACHNETDLFGKIIMINPPALSTLNKIPDKKSKLYKFLLEIPVFGTLVYNMITCQSNIQLLFTEQYLYNPFNMTAEWLDTYYESAHKGMSSSRYLLSSMIGRYTNNNINHALKAIDQSILSFEGEAERDSKDIISQYTECNPAVEAISLKGAKHLPHMEAPDALMEQLNIFLD